MPASPRRSRPRRTALPPFLALLAALPLLVAVACHRPAPPPPAGDPALLVHLEPSLAAGAPAEVTLASGGPVRRLPTGRRTRLAVDHSDREAVVTGPGVAWEGPLPRGAAGRLEIHLTWLAGKGAGAIAELLTSGGSVRLLDETLEPRAGWQRRELALPAAAADGARLRLESKGGGWVGWSEAFLEGHPEGHPNGHRDARGGSPLPNLILVSLDTVRADHLSLYGYRRPTSLALERFAAHALAFDNALSTSSWTLPSHATMLTGLLPSQHGVRSLATALAPGIPTVAERLRRRGYRTVAFTDGGFLDPRWGFDHGFERYDTTPGEPWEPKDVVKVLAPAYAWVRAHRDHPFFLFLHTYEAHQPYRDREGYADPFLEPEERGKVAPMPVSSLSREPLDAESLRRAEALYDGQIRRLDHYLGRFFDELGKLGLLESTAIVITSDHGEEFQEHGNLEHGLGKVFTENLWVPMIVRPPGGVEGRHLADAVSTLDVAPTLLALAGVGDGHLLPGVSLLRPSTKTSEGGEAGRADEQGGGPRYRLSHGYNSHPQLHEERYRLDGPQRTLIYDRVRGELAVYSRPDPRSPVLGEPLAAAEAGGDPLVARLQTLLAWLSDGRFAARLDPQAASLAVRPGDGLRPLGVWDGLAWRPAPGSGSDEGNESGGGKTPWRTDLAGGRPGCLVFDLLPAARGWRVWLGRPGSPPASFPLAAERSAAAPGWTPLRGALPGPGVVFPTSPVHRPDAAEVGSEAERELRALGYLR